MGVMKVFMQLHVTITYNIYKLIFFCQIQQGIAHVYKRDYKKFIWLFLLRLIYDTKPEFTVF